MLNEELSISDEVVKISKDLKDQILKDYLTLKSLVIGKYRFREGYFNYIFYNETFVITYRIYSNLVEPNLLNSRYDLIQKELDLLLEMFNGNPFSKYFDNSIYHEVKHINEYFKNKKLYQSIYKDELKTISNILNNLNNYNDYDIICARSLYASFSFEQDALIHGLYGLMILTGKVSKNILLTSFEYSYVYDMEYCLEHIDEFNENLFKLLKSNFLRLILKQLYRFKSKFEKMLTKALNEEYNIALIHFANK